MSSIWITEVLYPVLWLASGYVGGYAIMLASAWWQAKKSRR